MLAIVDTLESEASASSTASLQFILLVAAALVLVTVKLVYACLLKLHARRARTPPRPDDRTSAPSTTDRPNTSSGPRTVTRRVRRRQKEEVSSEDAAAMVRYQETLRGAAEGKVDNVHPVVLRNMQLADAERADYRLRVVEPFEQSFFRAQCAALKHNLGELRWWQWLGGDGLSHALFDSIVTDLLADAPEKARSNCIALLDEWLLQGAYDGFRALRTELGQLEELADGHEVTLDEIHAREADALECEYSKDWLLVCVLRTSMPAMRREGVIGACPPRPPCLACDKRYDLTAPGVVTLTCFLPCGHWLCLSCFASWGVKALDLGHLAKCPQCHVERLPMVRDWPGAMVED